MIIIFFTHVNSVHFVAQGCIIKYKLRKAFGDDRF